MSMDEDDHLLLLENIWEIIFILENIIVLKRPCPTHSRNSLFDVGCDGSAEQTSGLSGVAMDLKVGNSWEYIS
jgi:hypothetical protein